MDCSFIIILNIVYCILHVGPNTISCRRKILCLFIQEFYSKTPPPTRAKIVPIIALIDVPAAVWNRLGPSSTAASNMEISNSEVADVSCS
mmetsp:Transcript_51978/g.52969  ORF Transcript_51978/g.52969 Transcript_51978/m.52969 type:complete len:90 (+) Transcript_51978:10-279(+)